ncbi:MAG: Rpn family recombination-promoting nuclease/putative transposase [Lachnospiraceae bacterium]|nr:Rpn family recombination-promoting nuclease/putative transposase [Lachnospiraceae bacterium]
MKLEDGQLKDLERLRDAERISMLFDDKMAFQVIMGVEGQTDVNYYMPVRCMELDALSYSYQCRRLSEKAKEKKKLKKYADGVPKGTKIVPIVTLVFYVGSKPWDGPKSVYDMLDIPENMKGWAKRYIPDYQMHIIDAKHLTEEEIDQFEGDLKAFLLMIQERYDEDKLKAVVATHKETWYAISAIKKDQRYIEYIDSISDEELAGGVYMDAVLDRIEARGEARGKAEGEAKINRLALLLAKEGRIDEFVRSAEDKDYQKQLLIEYGLEDED